MTTLCACEHHTAFKSHSIYFCPTIGHLYSEVASLKRKTPDATELDIEANRALHKKAMNALDHAKSLVARQCDRFLVDAKQALDERLNSQETCHYSMVNQLRECIESIDTEQEGGVERRRKILKVISNSTQSFDENMKQQELAHKVYTNQLGRMVQTVGSMSDAQTHLLDLALNQQENSNKILASFQQAFEKYSETAPSTA